MKEIKKAIFPVAGLGTRFLPATKANAKEMLPIVDKPLIQYAVEEAIEAGIEEMIFITSATKRSIEDHFDRNLGLEDILRKKNRLPELQSIPTHIKITYVRQHEALGLGHAILCAKHLINNEPFAILLADDLMYNNGPRCLTQMTNEFKKNNADGILAIEQIPLSQTDKYGIVAMNNKHQLQHIIEKPTPEKAPSRFAIAGRYILPADIFTYLENTNTGIGNEIQLTDAIEKILPNKNIKAFLFRGKRYDCGSKLGYAQANFDYTLRHPELGNEFTQWVSEHFSKIETTL